MATKISADKDVVSITSLVPGIKTSRLRNGFEFDRAYMFTGSRMTRYLLIEEYCLWNLVPINCTLHSYETNNNQLLHFYSASLSLSVSVSLATAAFFTLPAIDNLQNYCLGTRYGARSRSRLCRRLSISLLRYRHGLEKFLEHHFIPIRRRFNLHDLPTDLLRVQDPFFRGRRPIFSTGNDGAWPAMGTPSMAWHVLFLCGRSSLI